MTLAEGAALQYLYRAACAIAAASRATDGQHAIVLGRAADAIEAAKRLIEEKLEP